MYDILELNKKLLTELRDIANELYAIVCKKFLLSIILYLMATDNLFANITSVTGNTKRSYQY